MSMVICLCNEHAIMADARIVLKNYDNVVVADEYWDHKQKKFIILCRENGDGQFLLQSHM